jgi:hypothetical protein
VVFLDQLKQLLSQLLNVRLVQDLAIDEANHRDVSYIRYLNSPVTGHETTPVGVHAITHSTLPRSNRRKLVC